MDSGRESCHGQDVPLELPVPCHWTPSIRVDLGLIMHGIFLWFLLLVIMHTFFFSDLRCGAGCSPCPCAGHGPHHSHSHISVCLALEKQVSTQLVHLASPRVGCVPELPNVEQN